MKNNMLLIILFLLPLLSSTSYAAPDQVDSYLCVADTKGPRNPVGYNCKPPEKVTNDDFVSTADNKVGNTITDERYGYGFDPIGVPQIPALNAQGLAAAIVATEKGGLIPFHTHPGATELIIVLRGELEVVVVTDGKVYNKTLKAGDIFVIIRGLLHYQLNVGKEKATYYSIFNSATPGFDIYPHNLCTKTFNAEKLSQATGISVEEVRKFQKHCPSKGD